MIFKHSPFAIQDKNTKDLDNAKDYPTIADLMKEQKVRNDFPNTVHHRRDLDSLGQLIANSSSYEFFKIPLLIPNKARRENE